MLLRPIRSMSSNSSVMSAMVSWPSRRGLRCPREQLTTVKNYSSRTTINLKGYVVKDATGNRFTFTANHYLQPGDSVKLRGGHGTDSDTHNVVYRDDCNFLWNNDTGTIYLYKPSGSGADVHTCTKSSNYPDRNGYISFHS